MIYVDTSLILAELLAEDRHPPDAIWNETLVSSRLLEYEVSVRLHTGKLVKTHGDAARAGAVPPADSDAGRAPSRQHRVPARPPAGIRLAPYHARQAAAATAMGIALYDLDSGRR